MKTYSLLIGLLLSLPVLANAQSAGPLQLVQTISMPNARLRRFPKTYLRDRRCGDDYFQQNDPDHYELVVNVPSAVGIRTGYFFTKRDRLYVGIFAKRNESAQIWAYEAED